jgi:hypothetical protein
MNRSYPSRQSNTRKTCGRHLGLLQPKDIYRYEVIFDHYHPSICCVKHRLMNWSARVSRECKGDFAGQRKHANVAALLLAPLGVPKYF